MAECHVHVLLETDPRLQSYYEEVEAEDTNGDSSLIPVMPSPVTGEVSEINSQVHDHESCHSCDSIIRLFI